VKMGSEEGFLLTPEVWLSMRGAPPFSLDSGMAGQIGVRRTLSSDPVFNNQRRAARRAAEAVNSLRRKPGVKS